MGGVRGGGKPGSQAPGFRATSTIWIAGLGVCEGSWLYVPDSGLGNGWTFRVRST